MADLVNHPPHYTTGKIEVIDFIEDQQFGYHLGQVIKYVCRSAHKGAQIQDLEKARWYLSREIERLTRWYLSSEIERLKKTVAS